MYMCKWKGLQVISDLVFVFIIIISQYMYILVQVTLSIYLILENMQNWWVVLRKRVNFPSPICNQFVSYLPILLWKIFRRAAFIGFILENFHILRSLASSMLIWNLPPTHTCSIPTISFRKRLHCGSNFLMNVLLPATNLDLSSFSLRSPSNIMVIVRENELRK